MTAARTLDAAARDRLSARFARDPKGREGHARWLARYLGQPVPAPAPRPARFEYRADPTMAAPLPVEAVPLFEVAIVFRDGRPDTVLTPAGVPEDEAISIWRTYRDSVERAAGVVGVFPVRP